MKYRCPSCKKVVERASKKMWVKSFCDVAGRTVHLQRVKKPRRCCDNGFFGIKHKCQKQPGQ